MSCEFTDVADMFTSHVVKTRQQIWLRTCLWRSTHRPPWRVETRTRLDVVERRYLHVSEQRNHFKLLQHKHYCQSGRSSPQMYIWLPIKEWILFKLATVTYNARLSGLPEYLQCEIHDYHPSRTLHSTSAATISARAFCAAAPTVWNSLHVHTHSADTSDIKEPA